MIKTFNVRRKTVLKREDGSRVQITTALGIDHNTAGGWHTYRQQVDTCEKGRRTWCPVYDDNAFDFRRLKFGSKERAAYIRAKMLEVVTEAELAAAALELWEQMKP